MNKPYTNTDLYAVRRSQNPSGKLYLFTFLLSFIVLGSSCNAIHNLFAPKTGCPSDGKNVGAERILSGEKVPKASKFKA